ncbi:MAG: SH3 domain-containing protein [Bryobacteraceae bacterium]
MNFRVVASALNLRSEPRVLPANRIALLPQGHLVTKLADADDPAWIRVSTTLDGASLEGFVAREHLLPEAGAPTPPAAAGLRPVHLRENRPEVTRQNQSLLAFPLGESDRPSRTAPDPAELVAIVDYLAVDSSPRYQKRHGDTFCNIYAYDYCCLARVFLPRVWWTPPAVVRLARGEEVQVQFGVTVGEINANGLFSWLRDFGSEFGWSRAASESAVQDAANAGRPAVIVAQRVSLNLPGHISVVVPESADRQARRSGGAVTVPLQSQAGGTNFRFSASAGRWWTHQKFRDAAFWIAP